MKIITATLALFLSLPNLFSQESNQNIISYDIDNFWMAYDKITTTKDSAQQYEYLNKLFLEKGSPGLKAIMEVRDYTDKSYIDAINNYPLFWQSIRQNTLRARDFARDIEADLNKIKAIYPELKPAKIYFTVGAFRTNGTTLNEMVLIGSEMALADKNTVTTEFPATMAHLKPFFSTNPINNVSFGNVHEYIHTQQKTTIGDNLLAQSVLEGVAEFVAVLATSKQSTTPAIAYGQKNASLVRERFSTQLFNSFTGFWLYNNAENEFNTRDLGYYTGYAICESYYKKASDKKMAIKKMIELDYNNEEELRNFVDQSGYFGKPVTFFKKQFDESRPIVVKIAEFVNGDKQVDPNLKQITIVFSKEMDERFRNFELGPLGEANLLRLKNVVGFSEDKRSVTFEIELKPNQQYQILVNSGFRNKANYPLSLKPYLIDFKTAAK